MGRIIAWSIVCLIIVFFLLVILIRTPFVQQKITDKATAWFSEKTGAHLTIDKLFITFSGNLLIRGLYLEDMQADTLIYSQTLEGGVAIIPLISGRINITGINWKGVVANVHRPADGNFNYQFIIDAFASSGEEKNNDPGGLPEIALGPVRLNDFRLEYEDTQAGIFSRLNLGSFILNLGEIDLQTNFFHIKNLSFENSEIVLKMKEEPSTSKIDGNGESSSFGMKVDNLMLGNIRFHYESVSDNLSAHGELGELRLRLEEFDLEKQHLAADHFSLAKTVLFLKLPSSESTADTASLSTPFEWPAWNISVRRIDYTGNTTSITLGDKPPTVMSDVNLALKDISYQPGKALLELESASADNLAGLQLDQLHFMVNLSDQALSLSNLHLSTPYSNLQSELEVRYSNFDQWLADPVGGTAYLTVKEMYLGEKDLQWARKKFTPDSTMWWESRAFSLQTKLEFSSELVKIDFLNASHGNNNRLMLTGEVFHPLNPDSLIVNLPTLSLEARTQDWTAFLSGTDAFQLPDSFNLTGNIAGPLSDLESKLKMETPDGDLHMEGNYSKKADTIHFSGELAALELNLGKILRQKDIGRLDARFGIEGSHSKISGIHADIDGRFNQMELYGYDYNSLKASVNLTGDVVNADVNHHNSDLQINIHASALLDSINPEYAIDINLTGADLHALRLTDHPMRVSLKTNASFKGDVDNFNTMLNLSEGLIIKNEVSYNINSLNMNAMANSMAAQLSLQSDFMEVQFDANAPPLTIAGAFKQYFEHYSGKAVTFNDDIQGVKLSGKIDLRQTRLLSEVLIPGLTQMAPAEAEIDFDQDARRLNAMLSVPRIQYQNADLTGLFFSAKANSDSLGFNLGFERLTREPVNIYKTLLTGSVSENDILVNLLVDDEAENPSFHIESLINKRDDSLSFHLVPDNLILSGEKWEVPSDNEILIFSPSLQTTNFTISKDSQSISLVTNLPDQTTNHLGLLFKQFELATLTSLINPDEPPLEGELMGQVVLENPIDSLTFTAGLSIVKLKTLGQVLGNLDIKADNTYQGHYKTTARLHGEETDINLDGSYSLTEGKVAAKLNLVINKLGMAVLTGLSDGEIHSAKGDLKGMFSLEGLGSEMIYNGMISFENVSLVVNTLNTVLSLSNDQIKVDNSGVFLDQFSLTDAEGNQFILKGKVTTETFSNPGFDLQLTARNFLVLNSTRQDNDLIFGKALLDMDMKVSGNLNQPKLEVKSRLNKGTGLTLILPESELDVIEREGVVLMVNMADPDDIMTRPEKQELYGRKGMEVRAVVEVDPAATFRILMDERAGDFLEIAGEASLSFDLNPNGQMRLSGIYELRSGIYEMSLYNIVRRRLVLVPGSRITWSGDPLDAELDLTALYRVRTSASELMADQLTGADASVRTTYRQELPFEVNLKIKGSLMQPEISFLMDMPENQRGALGGNVYSRLQQLNNSESELNKQVFGLLVFGKFFPEGSLISQEREGTAAMARSSVSQVMSRQLNALTDQHIKGVELDFDLDSYTDYQSGSIAERTQLNVNLRKSLFSDRIVLQVGSNVDLEGRPEEQKQGVTDIIGDVSVEFLITEDGRYRLRGFRKNQFEGLVEGQLIITGISFIFDKEFNHWVDVFKKQALLNNKDALKEEEEEEKEEEEEDGYEEKPEERKEGELP